MWPPGEADKRGSRTGPAPVRWMPHPLPRARARRWLRQSSVCLRPGSLSGVIFIHLPYLGTPIRNGGPDDRHNGTLRWRQQHELVGRRAARARPAAKGAGCCAPRCRASVRAHWLGAGRCDGGGRHRDRARWCSMASAIPSCGAQLERCPTQRRRAMASTCRKGRWTSSPPRVPSMRPQCTPGSAPHRA